MKRFFFISALSLTVISLMAFAWPVAAAEYDAGWEIIPAECYGDRVGTDCDLNSLVQLFVNLAAVGIKILPYLSLLMLIWAGFNLISAGGNTAKIDEGKKMITSVVLGILIITVLAWAWSSFVVFILTGSPKVFADQQPWERDWWGGGTADELPPGQGCCIIKDRGCTTTTEEECRQVPTGYHLFGVTDVTTTYLGDRTWCDQQTQCQNFQLGCCIPVEASNRTCRYPTEEGCYKFPGLEWTSTKCDYLLDRCDSADFGAAIGDDTPGCCAALNSCVNTTSAACAATFYANKDCAAIDSCSEGCCIYGGSCTSGKINCRGDWDGDVCSESGFCETGCCVKEEYQCYEDMTRGGCLDPSYSFLEGMDCITDPDCGLNTGCCINSSTYTCQNGVTEASCGTGTAPYFSESTVCANVIHLGTSVCQSGGCCHTALPLPAGSDCNLGSDRTAAYCMLKLNGTYNATTCPAQPSCPS